MRYYWQSFLCDLFLPANKKKEFATCRPLRHALDIFVYEAPWNLELLLKSLFQNQQINKLYRGMS
jgi:hypothetical protein